jgi:hypothetical protein
MPDSCSAPGRGTFTIPLAPCVNPPPLRNASRTASVRLRLIIEKYTPFRRRMGRPTNTPAAAATRPDNGRQTQKDTP